MSQLLYCIMALAFSTLAQAFEPSTLTLTLINRSSQTFEFARVAKASGNKITMNKTTLKPGEISIISGTIATDNDLLATLYFHEHARLIIKDQRQFHTGQPVFLFDSPTTRSKVTQKTRNRIVKPRLLSIIEAVVEIHDKGQL